MRKIKILTNSNFVNFVTKNYFHAKIVLMKTLSEFVEKKL